MGVYIKGMKMPESCCCCTFFEELEDDSVCTVCHARKHNNSLDHVSIFKRADWCPLVEIKPHGTLIDRNALQRRFDRLPQASGDVIDVEDVFDIIRTAPTIIEEER